MELPRESLLSIDVDVAVISLFILCCTFLSIISVIRLERVARSKSSIIFYIINLGAKNRTLQ